jgi:hypothetical protein
MCAIPEGDIVRVLQAWPFNFSRDAAETIVYNPHTHIVCVHHVDTRQLDLFTLQDVHNDPVVSAIIAGTRLPQPSCLQATAQRAAMTTEQFKEVCVIFFLKPVCLDLITRNARLIQLFV